MEMPYTGKRDTKKQEDKGSTGYKISNPASYHLLLSQNVIEKYLHGNK
jgi:hypothetical protein